MWERGGPLCSGAQDLFGFCVDTQCVLLTPKNESRYDLRSIRRAGRTLRKKSGDRRNQRGEACAARWRLQVAK